MEALPLAPCAHPHGQCWKMQLGHWPAVSSGAQGPWEALPAAGLLLVDPLREPCSSPGGCAVGYAHISIIMRAYVMPSLSIFQPPAGQGAPTTGEASMCWGLCVDAECPEFIGLVDSSGLPVSRAQQALGTLHRFALLCPVFRMSFSGSSFCKNVATGTCRGHSSKLTPVGSLYNLVPFVYAALRAKKEIGPSLWQTPRSSSSGVQCVLFTSPAITACCCSSSWDNLCPQWALCWLPGRPIGLKMQYGMHHSPQVPSCEKSF